MTVLISSIIFCLLVIGGTKGFNYQGYKVYEVIPESDIDAEFLHKISDDDRFDIWKESRTLGEPSDVMIPPEDQLYFETELSRYGLKYKIVVNDVERLLLQDKIGRSLTRSTLGLGSVTFASYMSYGEHMAYLRRLAQDYSNIVTVETIGQSHEGRDIVLLKLSSGPNLTSPKPSIFIDAGIHCREWIAPPVALYVINQLIENGTNADLYRDIDWYILPNLNPDGYEFTQRNNRLWRKNRRLTTGAACYGTDLNRNFGYNWMVGGASDNPCSETFAGPEAFSEPEARALRDWFLQNGQNVKLYLTIHSFGEYLLYPWGFTTDLPNDVEELHSLGANVTMAIEEASQMGSSYMVNSSAVGLYVAAGVTADWVKAVAGVELSYTFELPNGDAPHWFMIPARQILPVVQETWAGIRVFYDYILEKFVTNATQAAPSPQADFIIRKSIN